MKTKVSFCTTWWSSFKNKEVRTENLVKVKETLQHNSSGEAEKLRVKRRKKEEEDQWRDEEQIQKLGFFLVSVFLAGTFCSGGPTGLSVWSHPGWLTFHLWTSARRWSSSPRLDLVCWDCPPAVARVGRREGARLPPFQPAGWLFCLSQWHNWVRAGGRWVGAAKHAGCRKRTAVEGRAGATGSEAWWLWRLPACLDPRLLRSLLAGCWLAGGSGP